MYNYRNLFFVTTRLLTYDDDNVGVGTGFFFDFQQSGRVDQFIVTNKHIVQNKEKVISNFLIKTDDQLKPYEMVTYEIINPNEEFIFHEEYDLAIYPTTKLFDYLKKKKLPIEYSSIRRIYDGRGYPIEDVFFIGYPDGLWDSYNYLPLLRKGSTATLIDFDYGGKKIFLIDAKTIPGSSGSPVFIKNVSLEYDVDENEIEQNVDFKLAGILYGRINQRPKIGTEIVPIPLSKENSIDEVDINIGSVIKSRVLYDFIRTYLKNTGNIRDWFE